MTITGGVKSQKMLNKMYDSNFTAKAVLNYTGSLSDANVKELVKMTQAYASGELSEEGIKDVIPIPLGFSFNPINLKLADSQFIEVKQYTALQIASAFGIKPYQIGDYTKSSYASAEAQQLSFYVDTLLYIIKQYEEELSYKLLSSEEIANGYHFKFNVGVILRADLKTQIETLVKAINGGLYKANEARSLMDLEWVEGGDTLLVNGTSIPISMIGVQYANQPEKPPEDDKPDDDPDETNEGGGQENA
jgi:HK97 family phage portal protein